METSMIGDKLSFAVDFQDVALQGRATYGHCSLWLAGHPLHDASASVCLDTVLAGLQGIASASPMTGRPPPSPASAEGLLQMMQGKGMADVVQHYFLPIEAFDDFLKLFFKEPEYTTFMWAVHPDVAGLSTYGEYPKGVQTTLVKNSELQSVVARFAEALEMTKR
jgi:hypothetical protein